MKFYLDNLRELKVDLIISKKIIDHYMNTSLDLVPADTLTSFLYLSDLMIENLNFILKFYSEDKNDQI